MTLSKSIGDVLYEKGIIGHVTVDLVSFPDPTSPDSHPLFWATDINCHLTDYASVTFFFDFLMEGQMDQFTGQYAIEKFDDSKSLQNSSKSIRKKDDTLSLGSKSGLEEDAVEKRCFMYSKYIFHSGIAAIQYKTFFHMCRLESISFDLEN